MSKVLNQFHQLNEEPEDIDSVVRFYLESYLDTDDWTDKHLYIVHKIIHLSNNRDYQKPGVPLYSVALKEVIGSDYKDYIRDLQRKNVIELVDASWSTLYSGKCKRYALVYEEGDYTDYYPTNEKVVSNICNRRLNRNYDLYKTEEGKHLRNSSERAELHTTKESFLIKNRDDLNEKQKSFRLAHLRGFNESSSRLTITRTNNRILNKWTLLSSDSRKRIRIDGEETVEIDRPLSQPNILADRLGKENAPQFYEDVKNEVAYRKLGKLIGKSRDDAKPHFYEIAYSHPNAHRDLKEKARMLWPGLIETLDTKGGRQLAIEAQKMEAMSMATAIRRATKEDIPMIPVYDGVVVKKKHKERMLEIMQNAFDAVNFHINESEDSTEQVLAMIANKAKNELAKMAANGHNALTPTFNQLSGRENPICSIEQSRSDSITDRIRNHPYATLISTKPPPR